MQTLPDSFDSRNPAGARWLSGMLAAGAQPTPPPPCPHCGARLQPWPVVLCPDPGTMFWCPACKRPVCLEVPRG
jgi:hypothetical protein